MGAGDDRGASPLDRLRALVEQVGDPLRVSVDAEHELGEVVGADREAVEDLRELIREQHVRWDLRHHIHLEAVLTLHQAVLREHADDLPPLLGGAAERDHHLEVGEPHRLPDSTHRLELEHEALFVLVVVVAARAPPADHRVLFRGLEELAADQVRVLVGLEVAEAQDHRLRVERTGQRRDALCELVDEVLFLVVVAEGEGVNLSCNVGGEGLVAGQRQGVNVHPAREDELHAGEADAVVGELRGLERDLRVGEVHHDLGARLAELRGVDLGDRVGQLAFVDAAGLAFGAAHGDQVAGLHG